MAYSDLRQKIVNTNEEKKKGILHYLPFPDRLSRLGNLIGGIGKEDYMLITSISGGSKSTLMYDLTVNSVKELLDTYPDIDIKVTMFINILEESVESMELREIVGRLSNKGHNINIRDLQGRRMESFDDHMMSVIDDTITELEMETEYYSEKLSINWMSVGNPFGFYKAIREYLTENGKYFLDGEEVLASKDKHPKFDKYIPNNPKELVIVISDHLKLYSAESGKSWYESVEYFSQIYCRRILNLKYGAAVINVQQQASASEAIIFDRNGKPIIANTYPSLQKLGDITTTQRDSVVGLGIWDPHRYNVSKEVIGGLSIDYNAFREVGKQVRVLSILKNRFGGMEGARLPCIVDYSQRKFYQLPKTQAELDDLLIKFQQSK